MTDEVTVNPSKWTRLEKARDDVQPFTIEDTFNHQHPDVCGCLIEDQSSPSRMWLELGQDRGTGNRQYIRLSEDMALQLIGCLQRLTSLK